jgi:arginyl-tRNA synthetase
LEYYDTFYSRFTSKFDKLYFESEVAEEGKKIVRQNTGKIFSESDGAVIFKGEKFGLHTRVFITSDGNTTYEGKDMALAYKQYADFPFDLNIHIVANEQTGYFQVVIKALELIDPKFKGREYHLPMGMVNLIGRKISSRTGDILTVDGLLDEVKELLPVKSAEKINEAVAIGAVKYSVLKTHPTLNVAFDIKQSVNLQGNSGPYLQYTYARTKSVLAKSQMAVSRIKADYTVNKEELHILNYLYRFPEAVEEAAKRYSPNLVCNYLYELAQRFNTFYNQHSILSADNDITRELRLNLTSAVSQILANGMRLLGIEALERM